MNISYECPITSNMNVPESEHVKWILGGVEIRAFWTLNYEFEITL